jgi:sugar O-acyltransferase (sialic acid O-acetyltransferase NeuD family)
VLDILRLQGRHDSIEFVDENRELWGLDVNGARIVGDLDITLEGQRRTSGIIVALGNPNARLAIADLAKEKGLSLLNAVHPSAVVMPSATMGTGNVVAANSVINSNARLGDNIIVNTGAVIEHDSVLADGATVAPGVQLGGRVTVGRGAFVGTGAIVLPRLIISAGAVVGAGAVVTKNVDDGLLVLGVPARPRGKVGDSFDWRRAL